MTALSAKRRFFTPGGQRGTALRGLVLSPMLIGCIAWAHQRASTNPQPSQTTSCTEVDKMIPPGAEHSSEAKDVQRIVIAQVEMNSEVTVKVLQNRVPLGRDDFGASLEVTQAHHQLGFPLTKYIKYGDSLYLRRLRTVCVNSDEGLLALAFEAGSTDALQGFVFLKFSLHDVQVSAVPIVQQGGVEIEKDRPYEFDLWAADKRFQGACDACTKRYSVRHCKVAGSQAECVGRKKPPISRDPNEVTGDLIRVH